MKIMIFLLGLRWWLVEMKLVEPNFMSRSARHRSTIGWLVIMAMGVLVLAMVQRNIQFNELEKESGELHQLASLRVGQHDAHLTALSAIAVASAGQRRDLFLDVATTISRFYPRIDEVQLVPLDPSGEVIGSEPLSPEIESKIRAAAGQSTGVPELLVHPSRKDHYLLVKRSPNSSAVIYALALGIDATQLVGSDSDFWSKDTVDARISLPGGPSLVSADRDPLAQFSKPLESRSQPLVLETSRQTRMLDLLPPMQVAVVIFLVSIIYYSIYALVQQRVRVRAAEREAEMRRMEAQLTHASRVNALGEMASGMAHELTQPLTAILAQSQASRRLLARGDRDAVDPALADIASQAKRASAILERLRTWSRPQRGPVAQGDLRIALSNVETLLGPEAERQGVTLRFDTPDTTVEVLADQVEMEQVLHNLIRNALEALEGQRRGEIAVVTTTAKGDIVLDIVDDGPGIDEDLRPRLFTPFMTNRENGTGLGLALCQRLVERAGGEIFYQHTTIGAKFRIVLPMSGPQRKTVQ